MELGGINSQNAFHLHSLIRVTSRRCCILFDHIDVSRREKLRDNRGVVIALSLGSISHVDHDHITGNWI